jgi:hypothetical protein
MANINNASETSDASSIIILAKTEDRNCRPIDSNFVLLDSQLTAKLVSNAKHVHNICLATKPIKAHYNKGTMTTTEVANFGDMAVYINTNGIANVLSLIRLGQNYQITYGSHNRNNIFVVHNPHRVVEFHSMSNGLRIIDLNSKSGLSSY